MKEYEIQLDVTQEDIDLAEMARKDGYIPICTICPMAQALTRIHNKPVSWGRKFGYSVDNKLWFSTLSWPKVANDFDCWNKCTPCKVTLNVKSKDE